MSDAELSRVQSAFRHPFKEQVDFFNQKVRLPSASYRDIAAVQHDKAFVVAGAMKADLLKDLQDAVGSAIKNGESLQAFSKRFETIAAQRGWLQDTDKAHRAWRARTVYLTNMRTSHAAGRWQQMRLPEMLAARPYWQYRHTTRSNPRLNHQRLGGTVLPADDGWWSVNYPPNGYGCNCYVQALSTDDVRRRGLDIAPTPDIDGFTQDSFAHAPGSTWQPNLDKYSHVIAKAMVSEVMANGVFERWIGRIEGQLDDYKQQTPDYETMQKADRIKGFRQLNKAEDFNVAVLSDAQKGMLNVDTRVVRFSEDDALKQAISREGNKGFDASSYRHVQHLLDNATLVVREYDKKQGAYRQQTTWVAGMNEDGKRYLAILHQTRDNSEVYLKSYRLDRSRDEKLKKKGLVLYEQ